MSTTTRWVVIDDPPGYEHVDYWTGSSWAKMNPGAASVYSLADAVNVARSVPHQRYKNGSGITIMQHSYLSAEDGKWYEPRVFLGGCEVLTVAEAQNMLDWRIG